MFDKKMFKKRILFIGIPDMAYICLDGLKMAGVNIISVMGPKKDHETYEPFKNFVEMRQMDFIEYDNLDENKLIDKIKSLNIDLAVVCSFNYKIPPVLLNAVKDGFINIHPSLLPLYRGANPYTAVIANGERETGVTVHFMDSEFDTGDIIMQKKAPISVKETMGTLFNRLNMLGLEMLVEILQSYEKAPLPRHGQDKGEFVRGANVPEGELYIDYSNTAREIEAFIRGVNPFLVAQTTFRGTFMKIFSADFVPSDKDYAPGTIAKVEDGRVYIATKSGFLVPKVMQFGSFMVGDSEDFMNLLNPRVGEEFR